MGQGQNPFYNAPKGQTHAVNPTSTKSSSQEIEDIRSLLSKDQAKHTGRDVTRSQIFSHEDPAKLIQEGMGRGEPIPNGIPRGEFGFKERVNFNRNIGIYRSSPSIGPMFQVPSSKGIIIYGKSGFHIYPGRPY